MRYQWLVCRSLSFSGELPDGRYRVSLRSKGEVNVSNVAEDLGGGGHKCASGCSVEARLRSLSPEIVGRLRAEPALSNARLI